MKIEADFKTEGKLLESMSPSRINQMLWTAGFVIENKIVDEVTLQGLVDTGTFRNSISLQPPVGKKITVSDGVKYGIHLEYGTRPHTIRPKTKKALYWKGARHPVKSVRHPRTRAYRPFTNGLIKSENEVVEVVRRFIAE